MYRKMPNDTTAAQQPPKAHLGLPTTSWLRPSSFDKHSCPYVGQRSSPTHPGHFHHDLRSTTFTDREQRLLSSRIITNASSSKPRAPSVTPPIAHATCRNPDHTWNVYFSTTVTRKPEASTPDMLCPHARLGDEPPAVAASGAISARRKNSKSEKKNSNFEISVRPKISNAKFGIPSNQSMTKNAAQNAVRVTASNPSSAAAP